MDPNLPPPPQEPAKDPAEKPASTGDRQPPRFAETLRCTAMIFWGAIAPSCFLYVTAIGPLDEEPWQSGMFRDYATLLFFWPCLAVVYLFLAFGAVAICRLAWFPGAAEERWVFIGVLGGLICWLEVLPFWFGFCFKQFGETTDVMLIGSPLWLLLGAYPWVAIHRLRLSYRISTGEARTHFLLICLLGVALVLSQAVLVAFYFFGSVFCSAPVAVIVFGWATRDCILARRDKRFQLSLRALMGLFLWLTLNMTAWRVAYKLMLLKYSQAPTEPPDNCFIATAAAHGHRRFVCATTMRQPCGCAYQVTPQLQRLKAMELALESASPTLHRWIRSIYNHLGPRCARKIRTPFMADAAYLALKPCEWFTVWVVLPLAGIKRADVERLYRPIARDRSRNRS